MHDQLMLEPPRSACEAVPETSIEAQALQIRRVQRGDVPMLLRLCEEHASRMLVERAVYGPPRWPPLDLVEALCEPPVRVWAWIAEAGGDAVGYAGASAGCSLLERANYFTIESLYACPSPWAVQVERQLFAQVLRTAREFGCLNLQWRLSPAQASRLHDELPLLATPVETVHYVLPLLRSGARTHG